jgi:uncharacterized BrkB/YihY/UPF0761 family membrane protein
MLVKVEIQKSKFKSYWKIITSVLFFLFSFCYSITTNAQCAMCRAALESEGNQAKAKGINDGIVYLMVIPYILVGLVFFAVYKMYANKNKA